MVKKEILAEIKEDSNDLVQSWSQYLEPAPSETNTMFEHVYNQAISQDYTKI